MVGDAKDAVTPGASVEHSEQARRTDWEWRVCQRLHVCRQSYSDAVPIDGGDPVVQRGLPNPLLSPPIAADPNLKRAVSASPSIVAQKDTEREQCLVDVPLR